MKPVKPLNLVWTLALLLMLTGAKCTDVSIETKVDDQQKISDSAGNLDADLNDGDRFGSAIANIGDLEGDGVIDLAVGAPGDSDDRGAVWILFMDDDGRVDQRRKISHDTALLLTGLDHNDRFGAALASIGDLNRDGVFDIAVGAPEDDDLGDNRGAVWILFLDSDGTLREVQKISALTGGLLGDLSDNDQFGAAVASVGDLDGDSIADLPVAGCAPGDGGTGNGCGVDSCS